MSQVSDRHFSLADPGPDGRRPYINTDGAFIGWAVPLLKRTSDGGWTPRDAATIETLLSRGYGAPFKLDWRYEQLGYVAKELDDGNLVLASLSLLHAQLPPLASEAHARAMAGADGLLAKENPNWEFEPRVPAGSPGGEWTTDGGGSANGSIVPAAAGGGRHPGEEGALRRRPHRGCAENRRSAPGAGGERSGRFRPGVQMG